MHEQKDSSSAAIIVQLYSHDLQILSFFDVSPHFELGAGMDLARRLECYEKAYHAIEAFHSFTLQSDVQAYLSSFMELQHYAGDALSYKANYHWLKRDASMLQWILLEEFPRIDSKFNLLDSVVSIEYYFHRIAAHAHSGDGVTALALYEVLKSIKNYRGIYEFDRNLKTLEELRSLWSFDDNSMMWT